MSVLRPGAVQPKPDDEYEVDYCFGEDGTAEDIRERSLEKLLAKVCEGFNEENPGCPAEFSARARTKPAPAPELGEHTEEILGDVARLSDTEISQLFDKGVVESPRYTARSAA